MPFTLRNIKEDLEDIGSRFDGAPDLEFRAATNALALERGSVTWARECPPTAAANDDLCASAESL